jgi:hypothetical protein
MVTNGGFCLHGNELPNYEKGLEFLECEGTVAFEASGHMPFNPLKTKRICFL